MAEEDVMEDVVEASEDNEKKYITATLNKSDDAGLIRAYGHLNKIGGFSARDVFEAGVSALKETPEFKTAVKELQSQLE